MEGTFSWFEEPRQSTRLETMNKKHLHVMSDGQGEFVNVIVLAAMTLCCNDRKIV